MKEVFDLWLDRGMKLIGILGFFGTVFIIVNGVLYIPTRLKNLEASSVETNAKFQAYEKQVTENHTRFANIEKDIDYIKKSQDEMKNDIKQLLRNTR